MQPGGDPSIDGGCLAGQTMKTRLAIIAACAGTLILTMASLTHGQAIFDRWGNPRAAAPGIKKVVIPTDSRERGYVAGTTGGAWKQPKTGTACGFKICEYDSPRPSNR
jgi:hypothetical protein